MENNILSVMLWGMEVGRLYWDAKLRCAVFTYNRDFVDKGLDIAPLTASIHSVRSRKGMPYWGNREKLYAGLPEFIADSLPDHWGNTVFDKWAAQQKIPRSTLTPVDRLSYIGKRSMGALEFVPAYLKKDDAFPVELSALYRFAEQQFLEKQSRHYSMGDDLMLQSLYKVGTSAGGRRPKAIIAIHRETGEICSGQSFLPEGYTYCIVKFNENMDYPSVNVEKAYYDMALAVGITMMPSSLIEVEGKQHFLTERFDRKGNEKIHIQTLAAMDPLASTYEELFVTCRKLQLPVSQQNEQFRRLAFNVMACNVDDHTKNFAFMMNREGAWSITPAYDLTFSVDCSAPSYCNRHTMTVNGKDEHITKEDLIYFAKINGIRGGEKILSEVKEAVMHFEAFGKDAGVSDKWIDRIFSEIRKRVELF